MAYCTLTDLKDQLSWTGSAQDTELQRAIDAAEEAINLHCDRDFNLQSLTAKVYQPYDSTRLKVHDIANDTGLEIAVDSTGDGSFNDTWANSDFELRPLTRRTGFPYTEIHAVARFWPPVVRRTGVVQVTANHGWPAVPDAVEQACVLLAAKLFRRRFTPDGTAGVADFGVVRVSRHDPDVMALLAGYRRHAVNVGTRVPRP